MSHAIKIAHELAASTRDILAAWVNQNSYTGNVLGCQMMAALLEEGLAPLGWRSLRYVGDGCGDHLGWFSPAWDSAATGRILLVGHHDTVFPPGVFDGYSHQSTADGEIARGPGVLDMKGGFFVIRCALLAMQQTGVLNELPIAIISVSDEETGSRHSQSWLQSIAKGARGALVFESGRESDHIVVARKGTGKLTIVVKGRAAHAGNALMSGRNAIWALARVIDSISGLTNLASGITVNVGTIRGGTSANTVPAEATCDIDLRCSRISDGDALLVAIRGIAARIAQGSETVIDVVGGFVRIPMEPTPATLALHAAYAKGALAEGLGAELSPLVGGGSDANTLAAVGIPVIDGLGPRGSGFHTPHECIELASLGPKAAALVRFFATL